MPRNHSPPLPGFVISKPTNWNALLAAGNAITSNTSFAMPGNWNRNATTFATTHSNSKHPTPMNKGKYHSLCSSMATARAGEVHCATRMATARAGEVHCATRMATARAQRTMAPAAWRPQGPSGPWHRWHGDRKGPPHPALPPSPLLYTRVVACHFSLYRPFVKTLATRTTFVV